MTNESWIYQGRQYHGWFGHGTSPHDDAEDVEDDLFHPANAAQRVDYAAHCLIALVPRHERSLWHNADDPAMQDHLRTAVGAWYAASGLSRDAFSARFLNPFTADATVASLRAAASGIVTARSHADLGEAAADLANAAQTVGAYRWPRFVSDAAGKAVAAVAQGEVPGVTLVQAGGVAAPGAATLGRIAVRVAPLVAALPGRAVLPAGAVALAAWLVKHGTVSNVPVAGFGPADRGVAPVSAEVNGTAGTVLLYHGLPTRPPQTATEHTVQLRVGADGVLVEAGGRPVARLGADGQVAPLQGVDIPGLFHGPAATPPQRLPPLPGGTRLSEADRKALGRPETLPAMPAGPSSTATPVPARPRAADVLPGREMTPAEPQVYESRSDLSLTRPTGRVGDKPTGYLRTNRADADPDDKAQVRSENRVARSLANAGYRTVQEPTKGSRPPLPPERLRAEGLSEDAEPDLLVENRVFDTYTPTKGAAATIHAAMAKKIGSRQTHRLVVDLTDLPKTEASVRQILRAKPIPGLREVIVLTKHGLEQPFRP